ncbi:fumarylacetoacetate hydrolase family protein [Paucilactobacillus suebicus]|uniref:2-hydroxyhepta-2,4-diene-1,7-dioate isomerase n=1 Tax=Paucilactobacillus suebicus DSM 5007 = KCTC 3549 TaxID=1423807 RepID=A0A0R1W5D8_9LACO|nr:fumarylacetoacetate hydrolase family protein [Paucilactobacillus suebicus]KRM12797.1 2-hydroxyhepta-2,4-diene-1,7-dioate isomerase [Paucilactobacillus suebicus DSM 5007 = KCTC 3549]
MKLAKIDGAAYLIEDSSHARKINNFSDLVLAANAGIDQLELGEQRSFALKDLSMPIEKPQQILAVGMNFLDHSKEIHLDLPKTPSTFTKFSSSLTGPNPDVKRHGPRTDWETELVIVVGKSGRDIKEADALDHVAGYMVGEDISDRDVQFANDPAQFSLGKSFEKFSPVGPWLSTPDELGNLADEFITTRVNGEVVQHASLDQLIFSPAKLISYFSSIIELQPGDLIFTGTPSGTGVGHNPEIYLNKGDLLSGEISSLGSLKIKIIN